MKSGACRRPDEDDVLRMREAALPFVELFLDDLAAKLHLEPNRVRAACIETALAFAVQQRKDEDDHIHDRPTLEAPAVDPRTL